MSKQMRMGIAAVLALVCCISLGRLGLQWRDQKTGTAAYENAAALAQSTHPTHPPATEPAQTQPTETTPRSPVWISAPIEDEDPVLAELAAIDLSALREVNPDVVGWIRIPNSRVNYPLMQGEDNTFYLEHTWEGVPNFYGSIYLESRNNPDLTDFNTIIYGHNMLDGSMFSMLSSYANDWFRTWNPYVYIVSDAGILRYEVFSSYLTPIDSPTYGLSFNQLATREEFITHALENSEIQAGITPAVTDRILTLSTCTGVSYDSRRVVHAYLKMIPLEE